MNAQDKDGHTALIEAAREGREEIVRLLLASGVKVDVQVIKGALYRGHTEIIKLLLASGKDFEFNYFFASAAQIKLLLENGVKVNARNNCGDEALIEAARQRDTEKVKLLIECGANVDAQDNRGDTPLILASYNGDIKTIELLLACGANIDIKDKVEHTALTLADTFGHSEAAGILKSAQMRKKLNRPINFE
jgi:uncharacterized protein